MRTLVHLSDLHFGRLDAALLAPLIRRIRELQPHVVVVSGDLTQRAGVAQFREARGFLDALPAPQVVVPGNHDVPLYNVVQRFLRPLERFRRLIEADLDPAYVDDEIAVVGVNTARALVFKGGRVNEAQVERVRARLCPLQDGVMKIVVTHHPFDLPAGRDRRLLAGRAGMAMATFARCRADVLLSGHLHISETGQTAAHYSLGGYSALLVQAGTATSTRMRGEPNSFNVLRISGAALRVERFAWDAAQGRFGACAPQAFVRSPQGWEAV